MKGIKRFLGHERVYRRFIKDFSKIAKPLSNLLIQGAPFEFDDQCLKAFLFLKEKLVSTPIVVPRDWNLHRGSTKIKKGKNISGYLLCEPDVE